MEQISNIQLKQFFSGLVANPGEVDAVHAPQLKTLVELYPQSGILRALLARSSQVYDQGGFQQKLKSAAVYAPDRAVLYNLINYPEKLVKYVEPVAEAFEDEEEIALFEDDYSAYHQPTGANGYTEETVYEEAPINYFHESEDVFQHPGEPVYEAYQPVVPVEEQTPVYQETPSYYNTPEPQPQPQPAPVAEYNYTAPVYQPEVATDEPLVPFYQPPVTPEQPPVYYQEPAYLEPVEPEHPEPSSFNNLSYPDDVAEPVLPPIPGYHKLSYAEEMLDASVAAASVIDDEVYDEITGIEDIYIEPINRYKQNIPDVSLQEQQTAPLLDGPNELEDILLAQYGEEDNNQYITEEPVNSYSPVEAGPTLSVGEYAAPQAVEEYSTPEVIEEYSTADVEEEETQPANDEVEFEMVVDEQVKQPFRNPRPTPATVSKPVEVKPQFNAEDDSRVSMYNDEKMPYSFLWWLDKTRKEHAETHQPYVAFKPITQEVQRPGAGNELQQQYFENIFHLTSVEQLDIHTRGKRKESEIIDRFIQQDPQLKPPNTEKLDNENKAKKSSEDKDELVSETLARIYLDQMLYTKAIATYQKLLLKFPEKSSYFVAQIKLLEKKIN